jgi:hypothetical protein
VHWCRARHYVAHASAGCHLGNSSGTFGDSRGDANAPLEKINVKTDSRNFRQNISSKSSPDDRANTGDRTASGTRHEDGKEDSRKKADDFCCAT